MFEGLPLIGLVSWSFVVFGCRAATGSDFFKHVIQECMLTEWKHSVLFRMASTNTVAWSLSKDDATRRAENGGVVMTGFLEWP